MMARAHWLCISIFGLATASMQAPAQVSGWVARSDGATASVHGAFACNNTISGKKAAALDASGNLYVTGCTTNTGNTRFLTTKYDSHGAVVWQALFDDDAHDANASGYALALDASGHVYVTGKYQTPTATSFATVAYDAQGSAMWSQLFYGFSGDSIESVPSAIGVGASGVYVTGYSASPTTGNDISSVKHALNGSQLWARTLAGLGNVDDRGVGLAIGSADQLWVAGYRYNASGNKDIFTVPYASTGTLNGQASYDGGGDDEARAIALDANGDAYVTGFTTNASGRTALTTLHYSGSTMKWARSYGGVNSDDEGFAIALDAAGNVIVSGSARDASQGN